MKKHISKAEWVAMYEAVGLDQEKRMRWHKLFEARYPIAHQGFLEWLRHSAKRDRRYSRTMSMIGARG
jgi:hypothetical protein